MALVDALVSEHLRAAATDVRESEPPGGLADLENVLVTPHIGVLKKHNVVVHRQMFVPC